MKYHSHTYVDSHKMYLKIEFETIHKSNMVPQKKNQFCRLAFQLRSSHCMQDQHPIEKQSFMSQLLYF